MATEKTSTMDDNDRFRPVTEFFVTPSFPFTGSRPHTAMGEPLELQNRHLWTLFFKTLVICVLHVRRYVGALQVGVASGGEGNGPVRRTVRAGGESTLLEGVCVVLDEAEEPGGGPWNGEVGRGEDKLDERQPRLRPGFCRWLRSPPFRPAFPCNGSRSDAAYAGLSNLLSTA